MKFLKNIKTLDELKKEYKKLALKLHPDRGGNVKDMQILNSEYDILKDKLSKENLEEAIDIDDNFKEIINTLIKYDDLEIEIIGTWIWIGGNTKTIKETLKELNFRWHKTKKLWFFNPTGIYKRSRKNYQLDEIREKYGSKKIKKENKEKIKIG